MIEKKTEVLTIRISKNTKSLIEKEANKREWTTSKMAEKILNAWAIQQSDKSVPEINVDIHESTIHNVNIL